MQVDHTSMAANTNLVETQIRLPEFQRTVCAKSDSIKSHGTRTEYFKNGTLIGYALELPRRSGAGGMGIKCVRVDGGNGV